MIRTTTSPDVVTNVFVGRLVRVAAAGALLLAVVPVADSLWWVFGLPAHFPLQLAAVCIIVLPLALGSGQRAAATVFVLVAALMLWQARDHLPRMASAEAAAGGLTVASINLDWRNGDLLRTKEYLRRLEADVVVLPEYTPAAAVKLSVLFHRYPERLEMPRDGAFGIGLLSRHPLASARIRFPAGVDNPVLDAVVTVDGREIRIIGVHLRPPTNARFVRERDAQMTAIASLVAAEEGSVIVLGDFNDTSYSRNFRSFLERSRLSNAGKGSGYLATFPVTWLPVWIPIDHCLYRGDLELVDIARGPDIGADHFPLLARFGL